MMLVSELFLRFHALRSRASHTDITRRNERNILPCASVDAPRSRSLSLWTMSGLFRHAGKLQNAASQLKTPSLYQQKRFIGDLPVKPNKYIEDWGTYRENVEYTFKWNAQSFLKIATFAMLVPALIYTVAVKEFDHTDEKYNRAKRDFMGNAVDRKHNATKDKGM